MFAVTKSLVAKMKASTAGRAVNKVAVPAGIVVTVLFVLAFAFDHLQVHAAAAAAGSIS